MNNFFEIIEGILDGYKQMSSRRKKILTIIVILAIVVAYVGNVAIKNYNYAVLYEDLNQTNTAEIVQALDANNVSYRLTNSNSTILVSKNQIDSIKMDLATQGVVNNSEFTIEDYAEKVGLGTTKEDRMLYTQILLQTELSRQIKTISGVTDADVNIALGSGSTFIGNASKSTASVIVTTLGKGSLNSNQVSGIQALVAGKVANLAKEDVDVIDESGALLTYNKQINPNADIMDADYQIALQEEFKSKIFLNLQQQLQKVYGLGKVSVAVDVGIDFSHSTITTVTYDDEGVIVNEQLTQEFYKDPNGGLVHPNTEPEPIDVELNPEGILNLVRNWEFGKTEKSQVFLPGTLNKVSISVVYDGVLTEEEQDTMEGIIMAATGYNADRGDIINVAGVPFAVVELPDKGIDFEQPTYYYFTWLTNDVLMGAAAAGLLIIVLLVLILRKGKKKKGDLVDDAIAIAKDGTINIDGDQIVNEDGENIGEASAPVGMAGKTLEELMLDTANSSTGLIDTSVIESLSGSTEVKDIINQFIAATKKLFDDDLENAIELVRIMMTDKEDPKRALERTSELLIILGNEYSAKVLKKVNEEEMLKLIQEISRIESISSAEMITALTEFANIYDANKYIRKGGLDYARKLLVSTMGDEYAQKLTEKIKRASNGQIRKPFNSISDVDSNKILNILAGENPQTISLVLAYLNPMTAAKVLSALPKEVQIDVTLRLATMNNASAEVITAIESLVEDKVSNMTQSSYTDVGGIQSIADIINNVERSTQRSILDTLAETHPKISARIRESLFVFEDILTLSDTDVQTIMRDIEHKIIAVSFKGISEDLINKIISNVSKRNREIIESEVELLGPVSVREIEEAQAQILFRIQELDELGDITIEKQRGETNDYVY